MPQKAEYRVLEGPSAQLEMKLNELAQEGYEPILMSSLTTNYGIVFTVILEHVFAN